MTFSRMNILTALASTLASTTIFTLAAEAMVSSEIEAASKLLGANLVNEVRFAEGSPLLDEEARAEIRSFIQEAQKKGHITEVKVAIWADKEYELEPSKEQSTDIKLSEARAQTITNYLTRDLALSNVKSYNMSKKPNPLLKTLIASPGNSMNNDYIFTRVNKSRAVFMIYLR